MNLPSPKFGLSQSSLRVEDQRLLTGQGRYVDDTAPEGALFGYVVRSTVAHAEFDPLDADELAEMDGVHLVLTAERLAEAGFENAMGHSPAKSPLDGRVGAKPVRPLLAHGRVRFVGEPLAFIVAETLAQARDAAEAVFPEYNDLEVKIDVNAGGPVLHDVAPDNVSYVWEKGDEAAVDAALAGAAHHIKVRVEDNRIICASLEPRGAWAQMEEGRLHLSVNGQGVWGLKGTISKLLGLDAEEVRITNPDVGGGFGMKAMEYPEQMLVAIATKMLERPVRWMSERTEAMLSDNSGRDLVCEAALGFDTDLKLIAYKCENIANMGAYNSGFSQNIQSDLFSRVLPGVYDVQTTFLRSTGIYTNTTQVDAYRGAGRPEAIHVLERAMDTAARQLGVDPFKLRQRSFIRPDQFPYVSAVGETYDVGDFERVQARAMDEADVAGFAARRAASAEDGKLRGLGSCFYIESILGAPTEHAEIVFEDTGRVTLYVGTQSNGQGHETVYRQFLATDLGLDPALVDVVQGDSDRIETGGGTGGSRSVTTQGSANRVTALKVVEKFSPFVAEMLDVSDVHFDEGAFRAEGSNTVITLLEAAQAARDAARNDLLATRESATLPGRSFPNGCHICEVEIDPETGFVAVERYTVADDFGNLMNPMLAEGQVHGGVVQGIGQALNEHVVFDETGQLLTATFMDYGVPRAQDVPMIEFHSEPVPSTANILGMKGCGEAGTVGAMAAMGNAVLDALWAQGVRVADMPYTPQRVWEMLREADA